MPRFQPEFDAVGLGFSLFAVGILLYFGLLYPAFFQTYWVAFAFWSAGFFGSHFLGLTKATRFMTFSKLLSIGAVTGALILLDFGIQAGFNLAAQATTMDAIATKLLSCAVGISEELFFGIFLLGLLINWMGFHPFFSVLISAGVHACYHIPQWGANPFLLGMWFLIFLVARSIYVYLFPKVSVLLGWHGIFNLGVS